MRLTRAGSVTEKKQAGFQPLSSRIPAAGNEAFSGACLAIANPRDFAPFHPEQPAWGQAQMPPISAR
jgi:hypothetical protein